ncbi:porin [Paraburkholderia sp. SIMBA_054]|jgi:predicted porin|uniref:porin n=1 Tax=Paraburkholderia TaxID=1822464 RepID=UPI003979E188
MNNPVLRRLGGLALSSIALGVAHAQSSLSISGHMDGGVDYISNQNGAKSVLFDSGILAPNLLTIKGREDLGGGNSALFELTSQFDLGTGQTIPQAGDIFNRTALVGIENSHWGTVTFGTQYDFMFSTLTLNRFDGALLYGGLYGFRQGPFSALGVPENPTGAFDFDRMAGATRVSNAVRYETPRMAGMQAGALYGFGGAPGSLDKDSTMSFGASYVRGPFAMGAAYVDVRYPELDGGYGSIRNYGVGAHYEFRQLLAMLLYTNTRNTQSGGAVDVYKVGGYWQPAGPWAYGVDYQFMRGNAELQHNHAHQITTAIQYNFSKRTTAYAEAIYQRASGDNDAQAWINGLLQADGGSSSQNQALVRIGLQTRF